ncbi:MAG: hypothetical protein EOP06_01570 [Proteobacteria bacterium]|nr:MAG: hypothetical protein EOP06_01570 [Pseudomonadota bacterium]
MIYEKFFHERITEYSDVKLDVCTRLLCATMRGLWVEGKEYCPSIAAKYLCGELNRVREEAKNHGLSESFVSSIVEAAVNFLRNDPTIWFTFYFLSKVIFPKATPYILREEALKKVDAIDLDHVSYECMPDEFAGLIRFPNVIKDDDGHSLTEIYVCIAGNDEFTCVTPVQLAPDLFNGATKVPQNGGKFLGITWIPKGQDGDELPAYLFLPFPENTKLPLSELLRNMHMEKVDQEGNLHSSYENDGSTHFHRRIISSIVYILSNQEGIQEHENKPRFQSSGSSKILRADRNLSRLRVKIVH